MSAPVRYRRRCGGLCYRNEVQARQGLDTTRQRRIRDRLPVWLIPTRYYRAACGRWHLGYDTPVHAAPPVVASLRRVA